MKKYSLVAVIVVLIMLAGCASSMAAPKRDDAPRWSEADLSFYDADGKERAFLTQTTTSINLKDTPELKTCRGVQIGDRANTALKLYVLTDFEWDICDFSQVYPYTDETKAVKERYYGESVEGIIELLPEIAREGAGVSFSVRLYRQEDVICTESNIDYSLMPEPYRIVYGNEVAAMDAYKSSIWDCSVLFYVQDEKIYDVIVMK